MSSACLFLFFYLNQMSHPTMFPTSHMRKKRTSNQTKIWYIIVPYGHVLVPLCVPLWICSWLIFRNLLLLIHKSVHFIFFLFFFCFLLCFPDLFVLSTSFFLELNIFLHLLSPPHCIIMTQYFFKYFISLIYYSKISRSLRMIIFVEVISNSQFMIGFSNNPILKTHSNKEHDNAKLHPPNTENIEKLVERIIHSVPAWRLSD